MNITGLTFHTRSTNSLDKKTSQQFFLHFTLIGLAYLSILLAFAFVWSKYMNFLYLYRDGEYNLFLSLQKNTWSTPSNIASISPLQGMTSMLTAINPYFAPGQWVFFSKLSNGTKFILSYSVYALEVLLSTLLLGIMLGFSRLHSFIASIWAALLLFPPFNYFFGLHGWIGTAPMYAHTLAMTNLCLVTCLKIGQTSYKTKYSMLLKNAFLIIILTALIFSILIAAPFYNAGMLLGIVPLLIYITLCSSTREQFYWRVLAGLTIIIAFYAFGLPEFYSSSKAYSTRFIENQPFFAIRWQGMAHMLDHKNITKALDMLCQWGVQCPAFPGWPIGIGTGWINTAIILGGLTAWLSMPQPIARLGLLLTLGWIAILLLSTFMGLGILISMYSPIWFFLMLYSLCALFSLCLLVAPAKVIASYLPFKMNSIQTSVLALMMTLAVAIWLVFSFRNQPSMLQNYSSQISGLKSAVLIDRHNSTPFIQLLKEEIALSPGKSFRGSVATIYGMSEGTLRKAPNVTPTTSVIPGQYEQFLGAAAASGSSHDLLDLWAFDIPTLSEYGQGISRPLVFYISKFLKSPDDYVEEHFAFPRKPNIDILRALGVRFVIIDTPLSNNNVTLRHQLNAGTDSTLFLYELSNSNLGNYSPTQLFVLNDINEFYKRISDRPNRLEQEAYIKEPFDRPLTPAYDTTMVFQKNGVHITAKSHSNSAVLLPIQFSNCYRLKGPSLATTKIMRANLIHTLIVFSGNLDINLEWDFSWLNSRCRHEDVLDTKNLV